MIIGLTGGIASGKSTVSNILKEFGAKIIDADKTAREISERKEIVQEIAKMFGEDVLGLDGKIDRLKVKEIVFSNKEKLQMLNQLIHPKVMEEFKKIKENSDKNDIIIFDVPLLFESGMNEICDKVMLVFTDEKKQIERMLERDGINEELAVKIINSQMGLDEKMKKSDIHINNSGTLEELEKRIENIYRDLKGE